MSHSHPSVKHDALPRQSLPDGPQRVIGLADCYLFPYDVDDIAPSRAEKLKTSVLGYRECHPFPESKRDDAPQRESTEATPTLAILEAVQREIDMQEMPKKREMVTIPSFALVYTENGTWEEPVGKQEPLLSQANAFRRMRPSTKRTAEMAPTVETVTPFNVLPPLPNQDAWSDEVMEEENSFDISAPSTPNPTSSQPTWPKTLPQRRLAIEQPPTKCLFSSGRRSGGGQRNRRPIQMTLTQSQPPSIGMEVDQEPEFLTLLSRPSMVDLQSSALSSSSTSSSFTTGRRSTRVSRQSRLRLSRRAGFPKSSRPLSTLSTITELKQVPNETSTIRWCPGDKRHVEEDESETDEECTSYRPNRFMTIRYPSLTKSRERQETHLKYKAKRRTQKTNKQDRA